MEGTDICACACPTDAYARAHAQEFTQKQVHMWMYMHTRTHLRAHEHAFARTHARTHARERTPTHAHQIGPGFDASPLVCSGMGCRPCLNLHVGSGIVQARIPCFSLRDARVPAIPRQPATSGPDTISMPMSHDRLVLACLFACLPVCLLA